jgi:hypothetical protein
MWISAVIFFEKFYQYNFYSDGFKLYILSDDFLSYGLDVWCTIIKGDYYKVDTFFFFKKKKITKTYTFKCIDPCKKKRDSSSLHFQHPSLSEQTKTLLSWKIHKCIQFLTIVLQASESWLSYRTMLFGLHDYHGNHSKIRMVLLTHILLQPRDNRVHNKWSNNMENDKFFVFVFPNGLINGFFFHLSKCQKTRSFNSDAMH